MKEIFFKKNTLYSSKYEDIYYNPEQGLEESSFVFIDSLDLPNTLPIKKNTQASLLELGLGTGLNLLLTWKKLQEIKWEENFCYYSIEGFPLEKKVLEEVFKKPSFKEISPFSKVFLEKYPENLEKGIYEISLSPYFKIKLYFYPIEEALNQIEEKFNYFYLDGFDPKKNPDMWSSFVFNKIKEKKKKGSRLATFSSSRIVKDGLNLAEFNWQRVKGFGNKRHRLIAFNE